MTAPRERPILFSGPMVRAILAGKKTGARTRTYAPRGVDPLSPEHLAARVLNGIAEIDSRGCWLWGRSASSGYGSLTVSGMTVRVHRLVVALMSGVDERDLTEVCHRCDNPLCCNPEHLFEGTHRDNIIDAIRKGRAKGPSACLYGTSNPSSRLTPEQVGDVRALLAAGESQAAIGLRFSVSQSCVSDIATGRSWRHA